MIVDLRRIISASADLDDCRFGATRVPVTQVPVTQVPVVSKASRRGRRNGRPLRYSICARSQASRSRRHGKAHVRKPISRRPVSIDEALIQEGRPFQAAYQLSTGLLLTMSDLRTHTSLLSTDLSPPFTRSLCSHSSDSLLVTDVRLGTRRGH